MKYVKNKGKKCSVKKCIKFAVCKGLCYKHYQQINIIGKILYKDYVYIDGICKNIGCGEKIFAKDMCQKCYLKNKKEEDNDKRNNR